ncbi:MAG TPA: hypothetical protein VJV75_04115, partial [Candidatus Polarisedimenticolia bacterium]|nr:hypothetical protein [Candidatus Polarisedimenticolia bacterium]
DAALRMAALETLAVVGERGAGVLRDALLRAPGEIEATLACEPEEPPRVGETIPCTLALRNRSSRRIALALGPLALSVAESAPPAPPAETRGRGATTSKGRARDAAGGPTSSKAPGVPVAPAAGAPVAVRTEIPPDCFVDLAPGAVRSQPIQAGPVGNAGRYKVRAALSDLGAGLPPENQRQTGSIEASVEVRFEQ